jgi:hypothetical protein
MKKTHLQIASVRTWESYAAEQAEVLRCRQCGSNRFRETLLGPLVKRGRIIGGTKQIVCDECGKPQSAGRS